jgi:hypothetical protein
VDALAATLKGLAHLGELRIPCPQHALATEPCCLFCGERDGLVKAGGLYCHDCIESGVPGARRKETNQ